MVNPLSSEDCEIVREEEELLVRARAAIATARARTRAPEGELTSLTALRALQREAAQASADDLPPLLHELNVRQKLLEREPVQVLPDPATPYLAHLRVREGASTKDYLLGRHSLLEPASQVRIVDWTVAPVAQIFYRYREGDPYEEEFPGRIAEGTVLARRIVVFQQGVLTQVIADNVALVRQPDGSWSRLDRAALAFAAGGAGSATRPGELGGFSLVSRAGGRADITALLDAEQFAAVSAPASEPLLVLGTAGSGKTTVALHRLARIAARDPVGYPLSRLGVVVPEEGLARLSRRLLEPLGVGSAQVRTLDRWALALAVEVFGRVPRVSADPPALVTSLKRHPALFEALRSRASSFPSGQATLKALRRRLTDLYTNRAFLTEVVSAASGDLPSTTIEETVRYTMLQLADPLDKQLRAVSDRSLKTAVDGLTVAYATPDDLGGTVDLEDLPILLTLRAFRAGLDVNPRAHVVVDEAEDFSLFDLHALGHTLQEPRSLTLAGDEAQQTSSSFAGWKRSLQQLGVERATTCRLAVSYRCPGPVANLARQVLGPLATATEPSTPREGPPVGRFAFPSEQQAHLFVVNAVRELLDREPTASVAVLTREPDVARRFYELVRSWHEARLVQDGDFSFDPGLDVSDVDQAKGLEFDYVILPDVNVQNYPVSDEARRRLHVAITRAANQLWIVTPNTPSALLPLA